ncbi:hypothetical protein V6767_20410 [Martelella sp. FLE1502]
MTTIWRAARVLNSTVLIVTLILLVAITCLTVWFLVTLSHSAFGWIGSGLCVMLVMSFALSALEMIFNKEEGE